MRKSMEKQLDSETELSKKVLVQNQILDLTKMSIKGEVKPS
jgi:hypothetical protein